MSKEIVPNTSGMHDSDIDALIDRYVFAHAGWCYGGSAPSLEQRCYCCEQCGNLEELGLAAKTVGGLGHPRLIPRYSADMATAWAIVDAIKYRNRSERACFALFLNSATNAGRRGMIFGLTPRIVAVAALQALNVLDCNGNLVAASGQQSEVFSVA